MNSIQNRIIVLIWKKLLVKFVDCEKEILAHENIVRKSKVSIFFEA